MKKGFTLIELLAVIIILAVIALIATPAVLDVINEARDSSRTSSLSGYADAVKLKATTDYFNNDGVYSTCFDLNDLVLNNNSVVCSEGYYTSDNKVLLGNCTVNGEGTYWYVNGTVTDSKPDDFDSLKGTSITSSCSSEIGDSLIYKNRPIPYTYEPGTTKLAVDADDDGKGTIDLGFDFKFGGDNGNSYSVIYPSTNGYIAFTEDTASEWGNLPIDGDFLFPIITAYWTDLLISTETIPDAGIYYTIGNENGENYILIEWRTINDLNSSNQDLTTTGSFEIKLYEEGTIKVYYQDIEFEETDYKNGLDATLGVLATNTNYNQYSYNYDSISSGGAIEYYLTPGVITYSCFGFDRNSGTITNYALSCNKDVVIPSTIDGVPVTTIGDSAFASSQITSVEIPDSVTTIEESAFKEDMISNLEIPDSVTLIGASAFFQNSISNLTLGNQETTIGDYAFSNNQLTTVDFGDLTTLQSIGDGVFFGNQLTSVTLPYVNSLTNIGLAAFYKDFNSNVSLNKVYNYTGNSFDWSGIVNGTSGASFAIGKVINAYGDVTITDGTCFAFNSSTGTITGYYEEICGEDVIIPSTIGGISVTTIGDNAFASKQIKSVVIPNSVTTIGVGAFSTNYIPQGAATIDNTVCDIDVNSEAFYHNGQGQDENITPIYLRTTEACDAEIILTTPMYNVGDHVLVEVAPGVKYGFFVLETVYHGDTNAKLIADRNIGNNVDWTNEVLPISALGYLETKTASWSYANDLTYSITIDSETTTRSDVKAKLVSVDELTGGDWHFDKVGCDNNLCSIVSDGEVVGGHNQGFITSAPNMMWGQYGLINSSFYATNDNPVYGVRPVIEINKSHVSNYFADCFAFDSNSKTILEYNTTCGSEVTMPEKINGIAVENIGRVAFYNKGIEKINFNNAIYLKTIGDKAFIFNYLGNNILDLSPLINLTTVGEGAFSSNYLTSVTIPNSLTTIGNSVFAYNSLTSVTIPNSVTTIGTEAFKANQLTSVTIPNSVTTIGEGAFADNSLTSVTIPNSVITMGRYSFAANSLTSVTIPSSVTTIGEGVFESNQLTSLTIPSSVTTIGRDAFRMNKLTSLTIPNSVINIEGGAFDSNQLISVTIPSSVTSIGDSVFSYNSLTSVTIPSSVTSIGVNAFMSNRLTSVTIPSSVTSIELQAFAYNQLTSVTIPNSVTTIGDSAFNTNQLTSVTIPNSMTNIGSYVFNANQLTSVTIPSSVTTIGDSAFRANQLTSVTIPSSVITIGDSAFRENQLTSIIIPNSVTTIESYAFISNQLTSLTIPNSLTNIGYAAFAANKITNLTMGNSVITIGDAAFEGNQLTNITLPNSVTTIGHNAFNNNLLTTVDFSSLINLTSLSGFANNQITSVTMPNSVTTIGAHAFWNNKLTAVTIPNGVTRIGVQAFDHNQITSVTIPNSVTTIESNAFSVNGLRTVDFSSSTNLTSLSGFGNNLLTSITIPNSVTSIGNNAFEFNSLTSVTIPNSVTSIGYSAFVYNKIPQGSAIINRILNGPFSIGYNAFYNNGASSTTRITPTYVY